MRTTRLILLVSFALLPIDSVFAATIVVNDTGDALHSPGCATTGAGTCTLRDAITFANTNAGPDVINFNISGAGVHTIQPASSLPNIGGPLTIDGYSQPGTSVNTLPVGDNAVLLIELDGSLAGLANGLTVYTDNCTIKGLAINRFGNPGISIDVTGGGAVGGHVIQGNFIGTDPTGTIARGNTGFGIYVRSPNNTIGGPNPADRNVISANQLAGSPGLSANIKFEADFGVNTTGNVAQGNYVGTDASGTVALASANSGHGIIVQNG